MQRSQKRTPAQSRRKRKDKSTAGRDNMASNTGRKDYYVSNALEVTPHPNKPLRAVLGQPAIDRRFKYALAEQPTFAGSNSSSATPISLVSIAQGTTDQTRTGDRVRAKRLWVGAKLNGNAAATAAVCCRILVVLWNPVGAAAVNAPVSGQIISHTAGFGPHGPYARDYADSFQIVYDGRFSVNPVATGNENEIIHIDRALTVDMEFTAGATVPTTNNLYIFHLTDTAINLPNLTYSACVWYEDLDA